MYHENLNLIHMRKVVRETKWRERHIKTYDVEEIFVFVEVSYSFGNFVQKDEIKIL